MIVLRICFCAGQKAELPCSWFRLGRQPFGALAAVLKIAINAAFKKMSANIPGITTTRHHLVLALL